MKTIIGYIRRYFYEVDKRVLLFSIVLTAILIFINYHFHIDDTISTMPFPNRFAMRWSIYAAAFVLPYVYISSLNKSDLFHSRSFILLLLLAPAIFSVKAGWNMNLFFTRDPVWNEYWNTVIYWPLLLAWTFLSVFICWKLFDPSNEFYGRRDKGTSWRPYWIMLIIMVPLIALASTQPDFLETYPKLKTVLQPDHGREITGIHMVLFELSYGSDFVGIELFFRGFLVLAFMKWAGRDAILPMACFYCTIHFGKPLGECISSFFGGIVLGIVVSHSRSIWGGLMVHLGIAWLMELGGYIGNGFEI